jgi:hypothetical protein
MAAARNGGPPTGGVMIGITSGEFSRFSSFATALIGVMGRMPPGSGLTWAKGVDVSGNCNELCRATLAGSYQWLWVMGDDHTFPNDTVTRLMGHDVDVIVPHCLKRYPPWMPVVFSHRNDDGDYVAALLPQRGMVEIHAAGSAGMLIRRHVLEAVGDPWFTPSPDAAGLNEDLHFCEKVREAGFRIWCDPEITLGHIALHTVTPEWQNGQWHPAVDHDGLVSMRYLRPDVPAAVLETVA